MAQSSYHDLVTRFRADTKGFDAGVARVQKGLNRSTKSTKRQGQAFTQLAYALDDAQYGFRGVQNNIQAIAVSSGLGGPLVLGITAATVAIGYFVTKWEKASKAAKEAAELTSKALAESEGPIVKMQLYADTIKNAEKNTFEYKDALEKLKKLGFDPLNGSIDDFVKKKSALIRLNAIESATTKAVSDKIAEQIKLQNEIDTLVKERNIKLKADGTLNRGTTDTGSASGVELDRIERYQKRIKELNKQIEGVITTGKTAAKEIIDASDLKPEDVDTTNAEEAGKKRGMAYSHGFLAASSGIYSKVGQNPLDTEDLDAELAEAIDTLDFAKTEEALLNASDKAFGDTWRQGIVDAYKKATGEAKVEIEAESNELGAALQSSLTSAFTGIGEAIGDALSGEDIGGGFLKLLGSFMKQFGSALIAVGVAELALSSGNPFLMIAGGIALVAAGTLLSNAAASKPSLSGGRAGGSAASAASSYSPPNLRSIQGSGSRGRNVGGLSTRDGDIIISSDLIRQASQASDRKYSTLAG